MSSLIDIIGLLREHHGLTINFTAMTDAQRQGREWPDYNRCPLPATHRRLVEAHVLWHQVLSNYQEPDIFRANLNATIQALRNVTFTLQSEKHSLANFDEWYGRWQAKLASVPNAKWLINARNIVVKKGDLEITSTALVKILTWRDEVLIESQIPPGADTSLIMDSIPFLDLLQDAKTPMPDLKDAALQIERRWSVAELEGKEILETLADVYGLLSDLVLDAHAQMNDLECIPIEPAHPDFRSTYHLTGTLECMSIGREVRTQRIKLASGQPYEVVTKSTHVSENDLKNAPKKYKLEKKHHAVLWQSSDPIIVAENILARAKQILKTDKYHSRIMFIRDGNGDWHQTVVNAADRTEKHILMRVAASFVERVGADVLIEVSESWMLPSAASRELDDYEIQDAPSRIEVLQVLVVSREGIRRNYVTRFVREASDEIKFEETEKMDATSLHYLAPVFEVWKRQWTRTLDDGSRVRRVWEPDPLDACFCGGTRRFIECCKPMMERVRASDSIHEDVQKALLNGDSSTAEQLARASLAQYIIWIRQHTAPTRTVAEPFHRYMVGIDVLALQAHVRLLEETLRANKNFDLFIPVLERLSETVSVPELSVRLVTIAAEALAELGDIAGAKNKLMGLGKLAQVNDARTLQLATKLFNFPPDEVARLLRQAVKVSCCEFDTLSSRLDLARHLLGCGDTESARREVDLAIADASADAANRSMLADALSLRWEITQDDEDFRNAKTALEALDPEQRWETLARLLIDHGDYEEAKVALTKGPDVGDTIAHLLGVDLRLRSGETDSARELFCALSADSIRSDLLYPYAYTMGLVALACGDPALKIEAESRLRAVVQETPALEPAKTLLAALGSD
ncbi:MAG TPA: hypothetical protein VJ023_03030 [Pyrinomonadaceae bacterium]|nr:hypothetical protein [Pyrinomonadaceae bacterium]